MSELTKAFVIGGFSEDHKFLEAFTREISEGSNRLVDEAESITLAEGLKGEDKLNKEAVNRLVFTHSAGILAVKRAGVIVTLNGIEPTPLFQTVSRAMKVFNNKEIGREEQVAKPGKLSGPIEVAKHPSTLKVPFIVRKFSTVGYLIDSGEEPFSAGRYYIQNRDDEFGFARPYNIEITKAQDIPAVMLDGYHNQPLLHPRQAVKDIAELMGR